MFDLIAIQDNGPYAKGDRVTDQAKVKEILESEAHVNFVKVLAAPRAPEPRFAKSE